MLWWITAILFLLIVAVGFYYIFVYSDKDLIEEFEKEIKKRKQEG